MNLAFSALLLLLLLLPGFILIFTYSRGFWATSPVSFQRASESIAFALVCACVLHLVWSVIAWWLFGVAIDVTVILKLLLNAYGTDDVDFAPTMQATASALPGATMYLLSLYAFAALIGWGGHKVVRGAKLDRRYRALRFNNEWHYLLSGEILEFPELKMQPFPLDGVYLSAVVQHQEHDYLYRGIVRDFSYGSDGQLERVILVAVHRRLLDRDRKEGEERLTDYGLDSRYYSIEGDFFILRYADMKTVNIEYIALRTPQEETSTLPPTTTAELANEGMMRQLGADERARTDPAAEKDSEAKEPPKTAEPRTDNKTSRDQDKSS